MTPQLGTVFPGTPARFFARPSWSHWRSSLERGHGAAYIYYFTVRYSTMARIKLCKNPPRQANKSTNHWVDLRAKGGVLPPSVFS
jgi:hypothetical protein